MALLLAAFGYLWKIFAYVCPTITAISLATYFIPHIYVCLFRSQNLKKAYNAEWALVTGASSGIGKSLTKKLAAQGLNVVAVALDDKILDDTVKEIQAINPSVKIRKVGVDLSKPGYLDPIKTATQDIHIQLLFNNAGYMLTGFFEASSLEAQRANLECNAASAVTLTHHFLQRMIDSKQRGGIVFTSSAAAAICSPFTTLYAATKAFLSSFAAGLAVEVRHHGIDVLAVHPSPVNTRFYDKAQSLSVLDFFKARAVHPDELPDAIFGSLGRTVWRDLGVDALGFRLMMKLVDYNFLAWLTSRIATTMPDFKLAQEASKRAKKQT